MEKSIRPEDIAAMERVKRINFTNSVSGLKGAILIGTQGHRGTANLAMFNSVVHLGGSPHLLGFVLRPLTVPRHTYHNIKAKGYFTINLVHEGILKAAHQSSANYSEGISEFETCGLTPQYEETHPAPYVRECHIKIGLAYEEEHLIRANDTLFVVGRVVEILVPEAALQPSGHVDPAAFDIVAVAGLDSYYRAEPLVQLGYARPGQEPKEG